MIRFDIINPRLKEVIQEITGLTCTFEERPLGFTDAGSKAEIRLRWRSVNKDHHNDDIICIDNQQAKPLPNVEFCHTGPRRMILEVRIESRKHDDASFALGRATALEQALQVKSYRARLRPLVVQGTGGVVDVAGTERAGRCQSVAVLELQCEAPSVVLDPVPVPEIEEMRVAEGVVQ